MTTIITLIIFTGLYLYNKVFKEQIKKGKFNLPSKSPSTSPESIQISIGPSLETLEYQPEDVIYLNGKPIDKYGNPIKGIKDKY